MEYVTEKEIRMMFVSAYAKVKQNEGEINKINMFPVPDQDTGSNLSKTLSGIYQSIKDRSFENIDELTRTMIDASLFSASGNVGIIFTGFLSGFLSSLTTSEINKSILSCAFENGASKAKKSIQAPKNGTILDAIDSLAFAFKEESQKTNNIIDILKKSAIRVEKSVMETQEKMDLYKKTGVVDAGAFGFATAIQGFVEGLENRTQNIVIKDIQPTKTKRFIQILKNRYEVVCLIEDSTITENDIKRKLDHLGDCLDIASANRKIKIHIHTDYPDEVMGILRTVDGDILQMITTDMTKGEEHHDGNKKTIGIIIDGAADLPEEVIKHEGIEIVPFSIFLNDESFTDRKQLYRRMVDVKKNGGNVFPKTSQPSIGAFLASYRKQMARFDKIICVTMSSYMSGSFNSALQAKELLTPEEQKNIYVLDSLSVSGGEGILVYRILQMIKQKSAFDQIVFQAKEDRLHIFAFGIPEDPIWMASGGRISLNLAYFMNCLSRIGIRIIVGVKKFKLGLFGIQFSLDGPIDAIVLEIKKRIKPLFRKKTEILIAQAENKKGAEKLKMLLQNEGFSVIGITDLCPTIGAHTGPGTLLSFYYHVA